MNPAEFRKVSIQLRLLYPLWMAIGMFSLLYVPGQLIDAENAEVTVRNIGREELLFRLAIVGRLCTQLLGVLIPLLLYRWLKATDPVQALVMLVLALLGVPISMYHETLMLAIPEVLGQPERVMELLDGHRRGHYISFIFWGLWLIPLGTLVFRSGFLPRFIGVLLWLAGVGYFAGALLYIILPEAKQVQQVLEYLTFGEVVFILWLVIVGARFKEAETLSGHQD